MYGITETTVYSTYHRVTRADLAAGVGSRIGRPLAGLRMYVLDQQGHPTPLGVPGEIHLAGHGVALGYLNQPALTAQRFLPDPYGPAGSRMYRTGDLGIRLPDGSVEFLGRLDDQVKLRGYRIELGEVESALAALPEVAEAAVVLREDTAGDPRLVGYLAGAPGQRPSTGELRAALARTLPDYMIPSAFVTLDQLPRNNSGKLDRRALPAPQDGDPGDGRAMVAPRTALEERVAGIWAQVLGLPSGGRRGRLLRAGWPLDQGAGAGQHAADGRLRRLGRGRDGPANRLPALRRAGRPHRTGARRPPGGAVRAGVRAGPGPAAGRPHRRVPAVPGAARHAAGDAGRQRLEPLPQRDVLPRPRGRPAGPGDAARGGGPRGEPARGSALLGGPDRLLGADAAGASRRAGAGRAARPARVVRGGPGGRAAPPRRRGVRVAVRRRAGAAAAVRRLPGDRPELAAGADDLPRGRRGLEPARAGRGDPRPLPLDARRCRA